MMMGLQNRHAATPAERKWVASSQRLSPNGNLAVSNYVLLTGATGLVGRYLIRDLLAAGHELVVLIRPGKKESPHRRLEGILQKWEQESGELLPRPVCLEGDVCQVNLGLSDEQADWVSKNCDSILHNAAVLTFHGTDRSREPWRTNVGGTQNVLDFCRRTNVTKVHYVSTAYVCGDRDDVIMEDELDPEQGFRNDYEESKYVAEKMVREADFIEELTVYRPAVIAGDSQTGYTYTYHGLYMYLKLISVLVANTQPDENGVRHTPVRLNMTGDEPRNIVPVDWVSQVITHLFSTPETHGQTFHLAPAVPLTPREIIEAGYKYFNSTGVEFVGPKQTAESRISDFDQQYHENSSIYSPYEASDPTFDLTNLLKFAGDIPCPVIDTEMLHLFWKYGEEDRWGKRREPEAKTSFWVDEYLTTLMQSDAATNGTMPLAEPITFGLNVLGPGGGQWRLSLRTSQGPEVVPGLPANEPVLTFPSDVLASASRRDHSDQGELTAIVGRSSNLTLNATEAQLIAESLLGGRCDGLPSPSSLAD
jgi:thioester reductase-like protein